VHGRAPDGRPAPIGRHRWAAWALTVGLAVIATALWRRATRDAALSLTTTAAPTFTVTLNGSDQPPTYALPMSVSDTTGTGAGWHLGVTSTPFPPARPPRAH
jgi:hypothetical protein